MKAFLLPWLCFPVLLVAAPEWQHPLWLGRGGVWEARLPVTITNPTDTSLEGAPVAVAIGSQPGQADLVGARAEALRVTDARGTQLLYGLWSPASNSAFTTGPIPPGATLTIPAVCAPRATTTCYVYFDNPLAWGLSDFFEKRAVGELNGDFEKGTNDQPSDWEASGADETHRLSWCTEKAFSGGRCLQARVEAGGEQTWFGFLRHDITVVPGARCTIRVRVRGQDVKGTAGWYVHVGTEKEPQQINQTVRTGEGTFDWKEQMIAFTVPAGATRLQTGSVLYGTGTAWYDAFSFETDKPAPQATARAGAVERLALTERGSKAPWGMDGDADPKSASATRWLHRVPVRVVNWHDEPTSQALAAVDLPGATRGLRTPVFRLTLEGKPVESCCLGDRLLFTASLPARTILTFYLYVADNGIRPKAADPAASIRGSDIPSDQVLSDSDPQTDTEAFAALLQSPVNLLGNPDFENGNEIPEAWSHNGNEPGVSFTTGTPGRFGNRHGRLTVPAEAKDGWRGWTQSVAVKPGHTYLYGAWMASENLQGPARVHAHLLTEKDAIAPAGFLSTGPDINGTTSWRPLFGITIAPPGTAKLQLHLTMNQRGTAMHDGALVAECLPAETGDPESPPMPEDEFKAWSVDPVVKVFHETLPPASPAPPWAVALARHEEESLQIAIRSGHDLPGLTVAVDAPKNADGQTLDDVAIGWVGYVPIDHPTAYYNLTTPEWELKFPVGGGSSDGWSGWWPDPIRPVAQGDLLANRTQPLWITFRASAATKPGAYTGRLRLLSNNKEIRTFPVTVTVWDFVLPEVASCPAIYDLRVGPPWTAEGATPAARRERLMRFMAAKRVCPDEVGVSPKFSRDAQGRITADFTEYDQAARLYFDELKFPTSYTPQFFYLFGWEHPPKDVLGEKPYDGEYPYLTTDRAKLRPAYKEACQSCLRLFWDHVKAKGWAGKLVLYISDEPFLTKRHIIDQMKALCAMIHEVDPAIRIYSSTWNHCPDWNDSLDIWGVGHYGCFPVSEMKARRKAGQHLWFTTDGQMCTDTPFCAVERLLPHYCFRYGAEAYEFWGVSWLTYDPWRFGWHSYIHQSSTPGESYFVRYPNGDGFLLYPGAPVGLTGPVGTIRLEAARDGVEDFEYLKLLRSRADDPEAARLLEEFASLVEIPNAGGRFSSRILPDPEKLTRLRLRAGAALDRMLRKR